MKYFGRCSVGPTVSLPLTFVNMKLIQRLSSLPSVLCTFQTPDEDEEEEVVICAHQDIVFEKIGF